MLIEYNMESSHFESWCGDVGIRYDIILHKTIPSISYYQREKAYVDILFETGFTSFTKKCVLYIVHIFNNGKPFNITFQDQKGHIEMYFHHELAVSKIQFLKSIHVPK